MSEINPAWGSLTAQDLHRVEFIVLQTLKIRCALKQFDVELSLLSSKQDGSKSR